MKKALGLLAIAVCFMVPLLGQGAEANSTTNAGALNGLWAVTYTLDAGGPGRMSWAIQSGPVLGTFLASNSDHGATALNPSNAKVHLVSTTGTVYSGLLDAGGTSMGGTILDRSGPLGTWSATKVR